MGLGPYTQTGPVRKTARFADQFPLYATQYFRSDGGRFVTLDTGTGTYKLSVATDAKLDGWVDACYSADRTTNPMNATPFTSSSTSGASVVAGTKDIHQDYSTFIMPLKTGQTVSTAILDQQYDLAIEGSTTTTKQVVDTGGTSYKVVQVVAIDIPNNLVHVRAIK